MALSTHLTAVDGLHHSLLVGEAKPRSRAGVDVQNPRVWQIKRGGGGGLMIYSQLLIQIA